MLTVESSDFGVAKRMLHTFPADTMRSAVRLQAGNGLALIARRLVKNGGGPTLGDVVHYV